jgi:hypothetical protein
MLMNVLCVGFAAAQEPVLEGGNGEPLQRWSRSALFAQAEEIQKTKDSAYKQSMKYRAIPIAQLLLQADLDDLIVYFKKMKQIRQSSGGVKANKQ